MSKLSTLYWDREAGRVRRRWVIHRIPGLIRLFYQPHPSGSPWPLGLRVTERSGVASAGGSVAAAGPGSKAQALLQSSWLPREDPWSRL